MTFRKKCCIFCSIALGVVLIVAGIVFIPLSKKIIHDEIKQQINLNNKDTYNNWVKNPTPIYFQLYFWHLSNPQEVQEGREKPSVVQKGPYTYNEYRQKFDVKFVQGNGTVSYREKTSYIFNPEMSNGLENDTFTTVNIPMMLVVNIVKNEFGLVQEAAEAILEWSKENLFVNLTVKDFLWGYTDPMLNKTLQLLKDLGLNETISDQFGVFVGKNGSDDGVYNIKTGQDDSSQFGQIKSWNFSPTLKFWTSASANMLNGTDGTLFHPFMEKSDIVYVYSSDLCRSIYLTYKETTQEQDIDVYKFTVPPKVFQNASVNPDNSGFCYPDSKSCLPSGLLNVESCQKSAPLVYSQPHFLNADPKVINAVDGVFPNAADHDTVIDIEPNTGAPFFAAKKIQVNIQLENVKHLKQTEKIVPVVLPVVWLNESSRITPELVDTFKSALVTPELEIHIGIYIAIIVGSVLLLCPLIYMLWDYYRHRNYEELNEMPRDTT